MYILNGQVYEDDEKTISPLSQAFMFGYGLFETLKVSKGKMIFFDEHFNRLEKGCKTLKLNLNIDKNELKRDCYKLLALKDIKDGVIKVLYAKDNNDKYLLLTTRANPYVKEDYLRGFKLNFSQSKRNQHSSLTYVKSNNYMENLLSKEEASDRGFDEVIFLNTDNFIAEGSVSNIFWIKNEKVYTPSLNCGLLPGIVREKVLLAVKRLGIEICQGEFTREELMNSDEVFITNSIMDIMPVSLIEEKCFELGAEGLLARILKEYDKLIGDSYAQ